MGKLIALSVSKPVEITYGDRKLSTGIFKNPVSGPVMVRKYNIDGDGQADLSVHGGVDKAVYCYPHEHYAYWQNELGQEFPPGQFGENLTTEGFLEDTVRVGDRFRVGEALIEATQPRMPCFKFGIKMGDPKIIKKFLLARRPGFYCRVIEEGMTEAGDTMVLEQAAENDLTIAKVLELGAFDKESIEGLRAAVAVDALADVWKDDFRARLASLEGEAVG